MRVAKYDLKLIALTLIAGGCLAHDAFAQTFNIDINQGASAGAVASSNGGGGDTTSISTASNNCNISITDGGTSVFGSSATTGTATATENCPGTTVTTTSQDANGADAVVASVPSTLGGFGVSYEMAPSGTPNYPTASGTPPTVLACTLAPKSLPLAPYNLTLTPSTMTPLTANECESTLDNCYSVTSSDCGPSYAYVAPGNAMPSPFVAARTTPGMGQAIDVWSICRYIDDISASRDAYFVPFRTSGEWRDFIGAATQKPMSSNAYLALCSRYASYTFPLQGDTQTYGELSALGGGGTSAFGPTNGDPQAASPQQLCWSGNHTTTLPYARVGTLYQQVIDLSCNAFCFTNSTTQDTQCGSAWTNPVTITYTGGNSNKTDVPPTAADNGGWTETPSYVPPPAPAYPSCDPRLSASYEMRGCLKYAVDNCGGAAEVANLCPPPPRPNGANGSNGSSGRPSGNLQSDGSVTVSSDPNSESCSNCSASSQGDSQGGGGD